MKRKKLIPEGAMASGATQAAAKAPATATRARGEHLDRMWGGGESEGKEEEAEGPPVGEAGSEVLDHSVESLKSLKEEGKATPAAEETLEAGETVKDIAGGLGFANGLATLTDPNAKGEKRVKAGIGLGGQALGFMGGTFGNAAAPVIGGSLAAMEVTDAGNKALTKDGFFGKDDKGKNRDAVGWSSDAGMSAKHAVDSTFGAIRIGKGGIMVDEQETQAGELAGEVTTLGAGIASGATSLAVGVEQVGETVGKGTDAKSLVEGAAPVLRKEQRAKAEWRAKLQKASPQEKRAMMMKAIADGEMDRLSS